ncbi:MAG: OmpA family protein, partial [Pseudomonadota bacterium]
MRQSEIISLFALAAIGMAALMVGRYAAHNAQQVMVTTAERELETIGFPDLELQGDGLVLAVSGRVRSVAEQTAVRQRLMRSPGVTELYDNLVIVAPLVDLRPSTLLIQKDDVALRLTGEAPNAEARDLLGARAELANPGLSFANLMSVQNRRTNEEWFRAAEAAIDAVSALRIAEAAVERDSIDLEGAVSDPETARAVEDALRRRFDGRFDVAVDINAPPPWLSPYRFAVRKGAAGLEILACAAPDAAERSVILGHFRTRPARNARAAERCDIANGAPDDAWTAAVIRAIDALGPVDDGEVEIVDDRVRVTAFMEPGADLPALRAAAARAWPALYKVEVDIGETLPVVSPFALSAVKRPGDTRLTGNAPSRERAERWASALGVSNELSLARGAPEGWVDAANAVIDELAAMKVGAVTLNDRTILFAAPGDAALRGAIRDRLRRILPAGYRLEVAEARTPSELAASVAATIDQAVRDPSRYGFAARREADGAVRLGGVIGDGTMRSVVAAYARAKLGGANFEDDLILADGVAPAGWQRAIFAGIEALGELERGELAAETGAIFLKGVARSEEAAAAAQSVLDEKTPVDFTRFTEVVVEAPPEPEETAPPLGSGPPLPAEACIAELNRVVAENPIRFAVNSAAIDAGSDDALDGLGRVLERCPAARLEVGGHTDSSGDASANQRLSQRRAAAV